jgi:hypothetical protein
VCLVGGAFLDERGDGGGGVLFQSGDGVGVDVQGHGYGGVAEAFADDFGMYASLQGQGCMGMTQVVQADPRQADAPEVAVEQAPDVLRVERGAVLAGEDQVGGGPGGARRRVARSPGFCGGPAAQRWFGGRGRAGGGRGVVLGWEIWGWLATTITVWRTASQPASRSRSAQRIPRTSPRRIPVRAASRQAAYSRSPSTLSKNRRTSSAVQVCSSVVAV